jgi:hypothetical protein
MPTQKEYTVHPKEKTKSQQHSQEERGEQTKN